MYKGAPLPCTGSTRLRFVIRGLATLTIDAGNLLFQGITANSGAG